MANETNGSADPGRAEKITGDRFTRPDERPAGIAAEQVFDNIQGSLPDLTQASGWVPASTFPLRDAPVRPARSRDR